MIMKQQFQDIFEKGFTDVTAQTLFPTMIKAYKEFDVELKLFQVGNTKYLVAGEVMQKDLASRYSALLTLAADNTTANSVENILSSDSFINEAKSTGYTFVEGSLSGDGAIVETNPINAAANTVYVKTDATLNDGNIEYFVSRDNGATFNRTFADNNIVLMGEGENIVLKLKITGDAVLKKYGMYWR